MWLGYIYKEVLFSLSLDIIVVSINPYKQSKDTCILLRGLLQAPKNHLVGLGSLTVLYIILHGKFGTCNYDVNLERKEKKPNASLRSILITSTAMLTINRSFAFL